MGCLKAIFFLVLVVVVAGLAFLNRDRLAGAWHGLKGDAPPAALVSSPELADAAAAKLNDLESGNVDRVALSQIELQSLLDYTYRQLLPAFVDSPRVVLDGEKIEVTARVPVTRIPDVKGLAEAATFLPDTVQLDVSGQLFPLRTGHVALAVDRVQASRIPLPQRLVAPALTKLGRKNEPGLPADAMSIPLPPGARTAYVRGDSLIFLAKENRRN